MCPDAVDMESAGTPQQEPSSSFRDQILSNKRLTVIGEVALCSGFPTQLSLGLLLQLAGVDAINSRGQLSLFYLVTLSLIDATLILSLVWLLFRVHGESIEATLLGTRPVAREMKLGLLLVPAAFLIIAVVSTVISNFAPLLHNVVENPLEAMIPSPTTAIVFAAVATIAGGLREEVQRAFILHRFEQHLGGAVTGLVVFSIVFGLGHSLQGWDAAIATGLLGVLWGVLYLVRRSVVAPVTCHAVFNMAEVFIAYSGNTAA
ncbi:MAG: hypothetical protein CL484_10685 [Acidobacteria bacterium]|nr:hypothetical protein [Acidobacteriota bacterium]